MRSRTAPRALVACFALGAVALLAVATPALAAAGPVEVETGLLVLNIGSYDTTKGTYIADFYLWFRWNATDAPEGFTPERFEFMNGRAASRERIFDETDATTGVRETWHRVQANLYSEPSLRDYPYDSQTLVISIEDSVHDATELVYVPLLDESGVDEEVRVAGWRITGDSMEVANKTYTFGDTHSRLRFEIEVQHGRVSTSLKTLVPPFAFMLISGLSFFLHPSKVAQRLTLGTSMIISAVAFHISQTVSLPPLGTLILFDRIMVSVYAFLVSSLCVTTLIAIDEDWWKDRDHTRDINRYGAVATVLVPFAAYALLKLF